MQLKTEFYTALQKSLYINIYNETKYSDYSHIKRRDYNKNRIFELNLSFRIFGISTYIVAESCSSIREAFQTTKFLKEAIKTSLSISKLPIGILRQPFGQTRKVTGCFIIY